MTGYWSWLTPRSGRLVPITEDTKRFKGGPGGP